MRDINGQVLQGRQLLPDGDRCDRSGRMISMFEAVREILLGFHAVQECC
jgi:hypothetical protein